MNASRLMRPARAALLAAGAVLAFPALAETDTDKDKAAVAGGDQPAQSSAASAEPVIDTLFEDLRSEDIVVTAPRLAGQLQTDYAAEAELDETAIASYGVSNVSELLAALQPQTRSGRGRGSGRPVILINGRRIGGFGEVRNLPPEAIAKVEIFPEEVALQYGYAAEERVVNLVLKPDFRQFAVEAEAGVPTKGGRFQSEIEPSFLSIGPNGRINVTGGWEHKTMLLESERDIDFGGATSRAAEAPARSLAAASDQYLVDATIQRSLDKVTDASLNLRFDQTDSLSLLGPGSGGLTDPLMRDSRSVNLTATASVNGMLGNWRWAVTGNYADADSLIFTDRSNAARDRFDSSQETFGANANLSGTVGEGWAGPIRLSMTGSFAGLRFDSRSERAGLVSETELARDTPRVFASLTVPLLDPDYGSGALGRLSLTLSGETQDPSDFAPLTSWGANINWTIADGLDLIASFNSDEAAPSITQLGAAPLVTPAVTYYDFATGQSVDITTTSGGNPLLLAERRHDMKLGLNWSVPMVEGLGLSVNYNRNRSLDTASAFPLLTPEIEAAFPSRAVRDAGGRLVALDQRPVNLDRRENSQIRWGLNFGRSFGQSAPGGRGMRATGSDTPREQASTAPTPGDGRRAPQQEAGKDVPRPPESGRTQNSDAPRSPGGFRFGGRGGMFGAQQGGRWQMSLYHTVKLTDTILVRPGVAELDLLNGSATGTDGGSNRHLVELDGGIFYRGMGARLSAKYDSGSRVSGGSAGDLHFGDLATFNLRMFVDFNQRPKITKALPFLKGSRLRLAIDNLFDAQRRITDASGAVPLSYHPAYLDPVGRYVEIEWRKSF